MPIAVKGPPLNYNRMNKKQWDIDNLLALQANSIKKGLV
jgi:hypothetical protein